MDKSVQAMKYVIVKGWEKLGCISAQWKLLFNLQPWKQTQQL
jgi:hypothetical protein